MEVLKAKDPFDGDGAIAGAAIAAAGRDETARAKINLALHVTGRRDDGYHRIDTIAVFADLGDRLSLRPGERDGFTVDGPFAAGLEEAGGNLVLRARDLLRQHLRRHGVAAPPVRLHLNKNLPVASGIGGGSADAAAALRGLCRLWRHRPDAAAMQGIAAAIGADVTMCLAGHPLRATGIGDDIHPLPPLPDLALVLVNPLHPVSTAQVFRALRDPRRPAIPPLPARLDLQAFCDFLGGLRNDLQEPAGTIAPVVGEVLGMLAEQKPLISRMSGSGATCFGIFRDAGECARAARAIRELRPGWFVRPTMAKGTRSPAAPCPGGRG